MFNEDIEMTDSILYWNEVAIEAHRQDFTFQDARGADLSGAARPMIKPMQDGPTRTSRAFAIIHLAMFDAFHLVTPIAGADFYDATVGGLRAGLASSNGLVDACVAGAASTAIQILFGGAIANTKLIEFQRDLLVSGVPETTIEQGYSLGSRVARIHLDARSSDGSQAPEAKYRPWPIAGAFEPDPFNPGQGILGVNWGDVTPFGGITISAANLAFMPPLNAPAIGAYLSKPDWAAQLSEVKTDGAHAEDPALKRTPEQTLIGKFWGYDGVRGLGTPPRLYNQCVRAISQTHALTPDQNAVLFAVINMAMADAGIAAWKEKYTYHVGRPVTVMRASAQGFGNSAALPPPSGSSSSVTGVTNLIGNTYAACNTWLSAPPRLTTVGDTDMDWKPLGAPQTNAPGSFYKTPGFPAYPSGHSTFGTVCFGAVEKLLTKFNKDPNKPFTFVSDEFNGINQDADGTLRPYHSRTLTLAQAVHENALSRVYLGVHWRMDAVEGVRLGLKILDLYAQAPVGPAAFL
jgi:hypothetical protein